MSVLFPKVNKPRQWDYRPIYYDPKKDERQQKLAKLRAQRENNQKDNTSTSTSSDYTPTIQRGSFREAKEANSSRYTQDARGKTSRLAFWIALFIMLICFFYFLG